jgi:hypothetical protein
LTAQVSTPLRRPRAWTIASIRQCFPNRQAIVGVVAEFYLTAFRAEKRTSLASTKELSLSDLLGTGVRKSLSTPIRGVRRASLPR